MRRATGTQDGALGDFVSMMQRASEEAKADIHDLSTGVSRVKLSKDYLAAETTSLQVINRAREERQRVQEVRRDEISKYMNLPSIPRAKTPGANAIAIQKLKFCAVIFNFNNETEVAEKAAKREALDELSDFIDEVPSIDAQLWEALVATVAANLFRALPSPRNGENFDPSEDEPSLDHAWPHLELVYELFLRSVTSKALTSATALTAVTERFVNGMMANLDSEDPREREYVKTLLHRMYGKLTPMRGYMRQAAARVFISFTFETERHNGIADLLDMLLGVVAGFASPIKEEHKDFLFKALMPLHRSTSFTQFHQQLISCVMQFVNKEPSLGPEVVRLLLRMWPRSNTSKQVLFLEELEVLLEALDGPTMEPILLPTFLTIADALGSLHFQVATRAAMLLNNAHLSSVLSQHKEQLLPVLFGPLFRSSRQHWSATVAEVATSILEAFLNMDSVFFKRVMTQHQSERKERTRKEGDVTQQWSDLERSVILASPAQ